MSRPSLRRSSASSLAKSSYDRRLRAEALEDRRMLAITVDTSSDVVDADDSVTSLREAIASATAGDTIDFDAAVFTGGVSNLIRLTEGELEITDTLIIDGTSVGGVTITGDANGDDITLPGTSLTDVPASSGSTAGAADDLLDDNSRVLNFVAVAGDLTLKSLTITGGRTTGDSSDISDTKDNGGGIRFLSGGTLTLSRSKLSGNSTAGYLALGGGIYAGSGSVRLAGSHLSGNSTFGEYAYGGGLVSRYGSVTLTSSTLTGNSTSGYSAGGGGIAVDTGSVTLTGSTLSGNSTTGNDSRGGGIFAGSAATTLTDSTLSGNFTAGSNADGGGINGSDSLTLTRSTLSGNSIAGNNASGGGVSMAFASVTLISSTLSGNRISGRAGSGGGIRMDFGSVTLVNSTLSGNSATGFGGGLSSFGSLVLVDNSTVIGNTTTDRASGIFISEGDGEQASLTIKNSIVAGNKSSSGTLNDILSRIEASLTIDHSVIGVGDNLGTISGDVGNQIGTAASPIDPLLGPLADNGGPTLTHALLPGSPALDAGDPTIGFDAAEFDQRGFARVADSDTTAGARIDIGAYESQGIPTAVPGDYNGDNVVNAADYTVWRDTLGSTGLSPLTGADGDGDGAVTATDYAIWRSHFGFEFHGSSSPNAGLSQTPSTSRLRDEVVESPSDTAFASLLSSQVKNPIAATRRAFATPLRIALPENVESTDDLLLIAVSRTNQQTEEVPAETVVNPELQIASGEAITRLPPARPEWLPDTRGLAAF